LTRNDALPAVLPDIAAYAEAPEEVFALLQDRIQRYTMGDSTSVPVDTARRLLESIAYCAELNRRFPEQDIPPGAALPARWRAGVKQAKRIAARANMLLHQAQRMQPPVKNTAYRDTIAALPVFFRAYDADFFAHEIPCSFDYPLCGAVPDALFGAEYITEYLRRLLTESRLLRAFAPEALRALYAQYYVDFEDLLVNLCLPVAEMALLSALAGRPVRALALDEKGYADAGEKIARMNKDAAEEAMRETASRALAELGIGDPMVHELLVRVGLDLAARLDATAKEERTETD